MIDDADTQTTFYGDGVKVELKVQYLAAAEDIFLWLTGKKKKKKIKSSVAVVQ